MKKLLKYCRSPYPIFKQNLKMKLSLLFMFATLFALQANNTYSQRTKITLKLQNVSVGQIIDEIESTTEFQFVYKLEDVDLRRNISINVKRERIDNVLGTLFQNTGTSYNVNGKRIYLLKDNTTGSLILPLKKPLDTKIDEQSVVTGTVTDMEGQPLPGASVVEVGTTNGTQTDFDGNYTITLMDDTATLQFSYVGFAAQEIPVDGRNSINVQLKETTAGLDEVVVIGYGSVRKADLTGAVANADLESFQEAPNTNVLQSVNGSLPGLTIAQNEEAGDAPSIQVRGRTSINGNNSPLIIVDNAIFRGNVNDLNPNDIKSIDVLKDASSKAIYGAQAANGVIIITTKGGRKNKDISISYNTYYSIQSPTNNLRTLNRAEWIEMQRDLDWRNSFVAPGCTQENPDWVLTDAIDVLAPLQEGATDGTDSDWFGAMTSDGFIMNHQLSISGGSEKTSFFISGGYTDQENWVLNDQFDRKTVRMNFDTNVTPWLTLGANTYGAFSDFSGVSPRIEGIVAGTPIAKIRDADGNFVVNPNGNNAVNGFLEAEAQDRDIRNNISGVFYGVIRIPSIEGLSYRVNYSNNYRWNNRFNSNVFGAGLTGEAFKDSETTYDWSLDNILDYKRDFGKHNLGVTLVAGRNKIEFNRTRTDGTGFDNLDLGFNSIGQANVLSVLSQSYEETFSYQMGRLNYNFDNKYLLTATIRRDGYSGFAENEKIGYFPSVGLGWVLSEDLNLGDNSALDYLKLRGSYGASGNLTSRFQSLAKVNQLTGSDEDLVGTINDLDDRYIFDGVTVNGQSPTSLANPNLTWETTKGLNFGVDFAMFDSRLSGSIDYYNSKTEDLLWQQVLPTLTGFGSIQTNLGEVKNSGLEIILNGDIIRASDDSDFGWSASLNFSTNKNEVSTLLGFDNDGDGREDDLIADGLFIGESLGTVYGYEIEGLYQIADEGDIPDGFDVGTRRIRDIDGDGDLDADDRAILGHEEPAYIIGLQNTLNYKNFTLKMFWKTIQGGKDGYLGLNDPIIGELENPTTNTNVLTGVDWWSPRNPNATFKALGSPEPLPIQNYFQRDFVRLQDISLAYNFDADAPWLKSLGVKNLSLYVSGKNLITITDWEGWDPETGVGFVTVNEDGSNGGPGGRPLMKSITTGLNVTF